MITRAVSRNIRNASWAKTSPIRFLEQGLPVHGHMLLNLETTLSQRYQDDPLAGMGMGMGMGVEMDMLTDLS